LSKYFGPLHRNRKYSILIEKKPSAFRILRITSNPSFSTEETKYLISDIKGLKMKIQNFILELNYSIVCRLVDLFVFSIANGVRLAVNNKIHHCEIGAKTRRPFDSIPTED